MSRKPSKGKRSPATRLTDTVNQLSDGEFEDVVAILSVSRKKRKWLELIVWHRGKQPYETAAEKAAFEGYNLRSMRELAIKNLDAVIAELRSGLPPEIAGVADDLDDRSQEEIMSVLGEIRVAKAHAIKRCYLDRLVKLLGLESAILSRAYAGEKRSIALDVCEAELKQAKANLVLAPQIAYYRVEYLDKVITTRRKSGALDHERIKDYLESDFAKLDVSAYPPLLLSEKITVDEGFHFLRGDGEAACRMAESVWELDQRSPFLSPNKRAMLMVRLNDYYIAFESRAKGENLVTQFASFDPESPQNRAIYLVRFLVVLLEWATAENGYVSHETALHFFERNQEFVLESPTGGNRSRILIAVMAIYLGRRDATRAKAIFDHLYREKDQKPPLLYRLSGLICHLMILFDSHEVADLKHHAKNHREVMLEKGDFAIPALNFLRFLQINASRYATPKPSKKVANAYKTDLEAMIMCLERYQSQDGEAVRLFYEPFLSWLHAKQL
jgi:hypothetical protein